jgi:hypothetical protein
MPRQVLHVDETMYVEGHGFRPVFVIEGEEGYHENGTWPYEGKVGQVMPWFFGPTIEDARRQCAQMNERLGISEREAVMIVASAMPSAHRRRRKRSDAGKRRGAR